MSIIWCGGEPIDFIFKSSSMYTETTSGFFRSGYARLGLNSYYAFSPNYSYAFSPITTSCWLSFRMLQFSENTNGSEEGWYIAGLVNESFSGFVVSVGTTSNSNLGIRKTGGSQLAETTSIPRAFNSTTRDNNLKIDIKFTGINSGSSGNVKVYINNSVIPSIDYTGDISPPSGNVEFTRVALYRYMLTPYFTGYGCCISEIIVADEDTRSMSLVTHYPNAAGDTNNWTGAYTDVDEYAISDADLIYTTSADSDFQCNLSNLPSGTFDIVAVKVISRSVKGASGIQTLKTGIKSGGSVDVDSGQTLQVYFNSISRLMQTNPITTAAFTPAEINALQVNLRSAS